MTAAPSRGAARWLGGAWAGLSIAVCAAAPLSTRVDNPVIAVPVSGTVDGAPELVRFSGSVQVRSTLVRDLDGGKPPLVQLAIDLVDVVGRGLSSGARYVSRAEFVNSTELDAHEVIEFTFPFLPDTRKGYLLPRSGQIALTLRFDARNGAIVAAACRISGVQGSP